MDAHKVPPEGIELFSQVNGMLYVREPMGEGSKEWRSHSLGTSNLAKGRKAFARWLAKRKITNIDAASAPINSRVGVLADNGVPLSRQIKEAGHEAKPRAKGTAETAAHARAVLAERRKIGDDAMTKLVAARAHVSVIAAALHAAATSAQMLEDILGEYDR